MKYFVYSKSKITRAYEKFYFTAKNDDVALKVILSDNFNDQYYRIEYLQAENGEEIFNLAPDTMARLKESEKEN